MRIFITGLQPSTSLNDTSILNESAIQIKITSKMINQMSLSDNYKIVLYENCLYC